MLTAIMSGITKEELVTILDEKLEEKFQRKFDELKQQIDHKLAPLQKMVDEVMETAKFINAKYDDLVKEQKALKLAHYGGQILLNGESSRRPQAVQF